MRRYTKEADTITASARFAYEASNSEVPSARMHVYVCVCLILRLFQPQGRDNEVS